MSNIYGSQVRSPNDNHLLLLPNTHLTRSPLVQVSNVGSESLTDAIALQLSKIANEALCSPNSTYDAVVITHVRPFTPSPPLPSSFIKHLSFPAGYRHP